MDIGRLLSRSIELLWKFKFLLLLGIVMGLSGGTSVPNRNPGIPATPTDLPFSVTQPQPAVIAFAIVVGLVLFLLWLILFFYFRFVARGALVCGVQQIEANGSSTLREAWTAGHKFYARLLGLAFLVNVPLILFGVIVVGLAFLPILGALLGSRGQVDEAFRGLLAGGVLATILTICCAVLCIALLHLIVHPLYQLAVRAIVLEDCKTTDGIRRALAQARDRLGDVIVVYIVLIAARIGWSIVTAILAVPLGFLFLFTALGTTRVDLNAVIILLLIAIIPLWLLFGAVEGIFQAFESNVWTEAYLALNRPAQAAQVVETGG